MHALTYPSPDKRLGIHYYPDTLHYRESDLLAWLPEFKSLGISWLTLVAPPDRAIPEPFLTGLLEAGIEPILQIHLPLGPNPQTESLQLLFHTYANWGVHYVVLFDRPNDRAAWPANAWAQAELVERFLDLYLPLAEAALDAGLNPVFPPLEPGGDYWDMAFLRAALESLVRRGQSRLLRSLVLGATAKVDGVPLDWGAGGPERWPGARPYFTPNGQQNQQGFYIFDWYLAVTKAVLGTPLPILLFGAGRWIDEGSEPARIDQEETNHALENLALVKLLAGDRVRYPIPAPWDLTNSNQTSVLDPLPVEVFACNFWLLATDRNSPNLANAWFQPDGSTLPVVGAIRQWTSKRKDPSSIRSEGRKAQPVAKNFLYPGEESSPVLPERLIAHYLLLPANGGDITEWHLDAIRPYIKKYHPTVGYCIEEAALADRVTVLGGENAFPEQALEKLRKAGCQVERISGDGTSIATQFATR